MDDGLPDRCYLFENCQAVRCPCGGQVFEETGVCSSCGPRYCPDHYFLMSHYTNWSCSAYMAYQDAGPFREYVREMDRSFKTLTLRLEKLDKTINDRIDQMEEKVGAISDRLEKTVGSSWSIVIFDIYTIYRCYLYSGLYQNSDLHLVWV